MRYYILIILTFFSSNAINAQNVTKIQKAFENSYILESKEDFEGAINTLQDVSDTDSYEINLRLGWLYYNKGNFNASIKHYTQAIDILPYSEEAKFGLILPYRAIARWDQVIMLYQEILSNSPNNITANYKLGMIYYNQYKFSLSYKLFEKVVNLYPFGYDSLIMYAWNSLQLGKNKDARILFNKVLMFSPKDKSALEGLSILNKK